MKIVHVIQRYPPAVGGSETWCQSLARDQARRGHRVRVLTLNIVREQEFWSEPSADSRNFGLGKLDLDEGVVVRRFRRSLPVWTVHRLLLSGLLDRVFNVFMLGPHSRELLNHLDCELRWADVVHLHTLPYPHVGFGLKAARRLKRPVVITPHFHPDHPDYERPHQYRWLRRADAVVAISDMEKNTLAERGVPEDRIIVTGTAFDGPFATDQDREQARRRLGERLGLSPSTAVIACVARKTPEKGLAALVGALTHLLEEGRDVALVLAGPGFEWFDAFLGRQPTRVRDRVHDFGVVDEETKREILAGADVFAMPSRYEAFGIVYLEAWAAGLPVVGGADGAQATVIDRGGRTVPFDDARATAQALAAFLDDPVARRRAVAWGREQIRSRWNGRRIGDTTLAAYRRVIGTERLRLVMASNFYPPEVQGGAELAMARQVRGLTARGHDVHILAGRLEESLPRHQVSREPGSPSVTRINLHRKDLSAEFANHVNPAADREMARLLEEHGPDVVHVHNLAGLSAGLVHEAADRGIPVVMTLHDYWGICTRNTLVQGDGTLCPGPGVACASCVPPVAGRPTPLRNADLMGALARVSRFLVPSRALAERYREAGLPPERIQWLPNGLDLAPFAAAADRGAPGVTEAPLLYLGYLGDHKGLPVLLDALSRPACDGLRLDVAGGGERAAAYADQAGTLGLHERVRFLGPVAPEKVPELLATCSALIIPSVWPENAPLSITEAMASGRPVVGSRLGGIPELVAHEDTGLTFAAGNPDELAAALCRLRDDPVLARRLGKDARRAAHRLDMKGVLHRLEEIYRDLRDRPASRPFAPNRPVVAIAGDGNDPETWGMLATAEADAGAFITAEWSRGNIANTRTAHRSAHPTADVVVLGDSEPLATAAEAMALGVPFVGYSGTESPVARLATDSGAGVIETDPVAAGRRLARLLRHDDEREQLRRAGATFLAALDLQLASAGEAETDATPSRAGT